MTGSMRQFVRSAAAAGILLAAVAPAVFSSGTTAWEMNSYQDFVRGRFDGISLSREGRLSLAPKVETVFTSDQPVIWASPRDPMATLYAATGHRGRVYRIDRTGKASLSGPPTSPRSSPSPWIVTARSTPALRPTARSTASKTARPPNTSTPRPATSGRSPCAPDGALYVGTGDQGKIYRVTAPGQGELYYETGQSHITGLAVDSQGRLLAGTEPNGILYRISAKDKAFVLYDANLPEIRAIVPMPDGTVYAAALGGSVAKRAASAAQAAQAATAAGVAAATATTITVEAQAGPGGDIKPAEAASPSPPPLPPPRRSPHSSTPWWM